MKARVSQILFIALFTLLLAGNISAKGAGVVATSSFENEHETALEVENWMVNDNYWIYPANTIILEAEAENELFLEGWMTNETFWVSNDTETENEQEMNLEPWMYNANYWKGD
ncbi:hypothetical protein MNBD_BACTEROID01-2032 [hydrothermal vent metagenome]|uniref:Uncharacterized protein n=1 Tax=hydrothermal vent metagenome TaxID=652676 RepID=A0A3B0UJI3_9ZZZZ